jgi:putative FmdB family regulatory protein
MPRLLRDFTCNSCGKQTERFVETSSELVQCECGEMAHRIIGMPRVALDGTDPGFPGAYDRWATIRENNAAEKRKKSYYNNS